MSKQILPTGKIPSALQYFDLLPDSQYVRQPIVQSLYACSAATIWRMVRKGTLPAPYKLSARISAWQVGELRRALAKCRAVN